MNKAIKAIVLGLALAFTAVTGYATDHHGYAAKAAANHEFEFKQPQPKVSDAMYAELIAAYKAGNENAILFLNKIRHNFRETLKQREKDEPEDVFIGCLAYQIGGLKALDSINFAKAATIMAGEQGHTEEEAKAMVDGWSYDQVVAGWKLWVEFGNYGADCWNYTHGGFVAGMPEATKINQFKRSAE